MTAAIPFSVLDFAPIRTGETARDALLQSVDMARAAEALGCTRYWVSEHHGSPISASAATAVLVAHLAGQTSTMRVGAGGVMLPNHTPFVVAEQYGTLESLYPGRIDLGIGRASGSIGDEVAKALRSTQEARERFPGDLRELQSLFRRPLPGQTLHAVPGAGLDVPIWVLASSTYSAQQAAQLGLPLAFASHIGADTRDAALAVYRSGFQPSAVLDKPYVVVETIIAAADTDAEAQRLFTTAQQRMLDLMRGNRQAHLCEPVADFSALASAEERQRVDNRLRAALVGSTQTFEMQLAATLDDTAADEIMALLFIHDIDAQRRSLEIVAEVCARIHTRHEAL
jgi:luciferase family oxidoreductase group 1